MKGIWKIARIILVFFLSLAVIALAWYAIEMSSLQPGESAIPFIDFVLYLLGRRCFLPWACSRSHCCRRYLL